MIIFYLFVSFTVSSVHPTTLLISYCSISEIEAMFHC